MISRQPIGSAGVAFALTDCDANTTDESDIVGGEGKHNKKG